MRKTEAVIVACLASIVAACSAPKDVLKVQPGSAISGTKISVQEFDTSGAKIDNSDAPTAGYGTEFAQALAQRLQQAGLQAEVVPRSAATNGVYVVRGQILHIDGGSRAARYWAGFGAGAAEFAVRGTVIGANGDAIGNFADARRSGFGLFGGDSESLMHKCVDAVSDDIAAMIVTGKYKDSYSN